jgi:hypothetical protein
MQKFGPASSADDDTLVLMISPTPYTAICYNLPSFLPSFLPCKLLSVFCSSLSMVCDNYWSFMHGWVSGIVSEVDCVQNFQAKLSKKSS